MQSKDLLVINRLGTLSLTAIVLTSVIGCSNPTDANKENFKAAINDYYEQKPECLDIGVLPYKRELSKNHTVFDEFVDIGFLKVEDVQIKNPAFAAMFDDEAPKLVPGSEYSLTTEGESQANINSRGRVRFCYAKNEVVEVTDFTEPAERFGYVMSQVSYTYKLANTADWAMDSTYLNEKFSAIAQATEHPDTIKEGSAPLIQMSDKWKHGKLVH
ncbi:hypothetical protein [Methylophaga thalassica]|uniref:hypothetical protein n=1 Tax=Methylophaga aminisulfidivorans TaxID=230105 RepID=UPI003A8FDE44